MDALRISRIGWLWIWVGITSMALPGLGQSILYVDFNAPGPIHDGSSWMDAYNYLQDALAAAQPDDEIRVAQGIYTPDQGGGNTLGDRSASFQLINGVTIQGGYAGYGESNPDARDTTLFETVLSGDLYGNDGPNSTNKDENSYTVVIGRNTNTSSVLGGFTITAGNADGFHWSDPIYHSWGGGMYLDNGSPTLVDCYFIGNSAGIFDPLNMWPQVSCGGGLYIRSGNPTLLNCTFIDNTAFHGNGGGIYSASSPIINNCTFIANYAIGRGDRSEDPNRPPEESKGGGICILYNYTNPTITNCIFSENWAEGKGGGVYAAESSFPTITDCTFTENFPDGVGVNPFIRLWGGRITELQILGVNRFIRNNLSADQGMFSGSGTLDIDPNSTVDLDDSFIRCNLTGTGTIKVDLNAELVIEEDAVIDLGDGNNRGTILCDGLLRVKDQATILNTNVNVSRSRFEGDVIVLNSVINAEAGVPYGQFFIEDTASIIGNDIHADGDRYLDLDPSVFAGIIQHNRIYVTITEGVGLTRGGLLELRGDPDLIDSLCNPDEFFCHLSAIPGFDPNSWTIEQLKLVKGAKVNLTNRFDFGNGEFEEVLYVKELVLEPNSILNTAYNHIYYENFYGEPNQIRNEPLLGFSLSNISCDSHNEFVTRVVHNNYYSQEDSDFHRIHVKRVSGLEPDPAGMIQMTNLIDQDLHWGELFHARAKALFAKSSEEKILIQFEYLFCSEDAELAIYLTDVPELLDHDDPDRAAHYLEVTRLHVPPAGRPGAPGSGRMGIFRQTVNREHLDFIRGTRMEFELIGPDGTCILIDNWDPWVYCTYCMDTDGEMGVTATDYLTVTGEYGKKSSDLNEFGQFITCLDSILCEEGYVNLNDLLIWDWLDFQTDNVGNLCFEIPLTPTVFPQNPVSLHSLNLPHPLPWQEGPVEINAPLLIAGKRYHRYSTWEADYLSDRLYEFDEDANLTADPEQLTKDRLNGRLIRDNFGEPYQLNLEDGLVRLSDEQPVIEPGSRIYQNPDPWYDDVDATIHVGLQGSGQTWWGRPILDVAFDAQGYAYVVPVVVEPANHEPYLAAAKLQLDPNEFLSYSVEQLYASTPDWHDNLDPNHLREIEVDNEGNVYLLNSYDINLNDILWVYDNLGNLLSQTELQQPNIGIQAPIALHLSYFDNSTIYLASSQNAPDADSVTIYAFPRESLPAPAPDDVRQITINGLGHVTDITEDPSTGTLWVVGFTMDEIPDIVPIADPPFYHPYLAQIPYDSTGLIQAQDIGSNCNLTMPLSIAWMGSLKKCGGADLNDSGQVNLPDLHILLNHWLQDNTDPDWLEKADLDQSDSINLGDFAIMGQFWLQTGCTNP
jgi:predicted outer membrane repeat protein